MSQILHANIIGSGDPLLILHGFLGMSDNWKTLGRKYANNGFEVHLIDQRNHGRSFHSKDFDYGILAEDLLVYMKSKDIHHANFIGHSMGGKTVMQFAVTYPKRVSRLVVADIAPKYYLPHHHDIFEGLNKLDFNEISSRSEADQVLAKNITDVGTRQFLLKSLYWVSKKQLGLRFNLKVLQHKMEEIGAPISGLGSYLGSTLFLKGSSSKYIVENDINEIKTYFPNAVICTIADAGHWLHTENPTAFFNKTLKFLKH